MISKIYYTIVGLLILVTLVACELFTEGYGDKVDLSNPELTIDSPANGEYVNGQFILKGTASDDTGISNVVIEFVSNVTGETQSYTAEYSDSNWYLEINSLNDTIYEDGEIEFTVTVNDTASKNIIKSRTIKIDNTDPIIKVTAPDSSDKDSVNGDLVITGLAKDDYLSKVEIYIVSASDSNTKYGGVVYETSSWEYTIDTLNNNLGVDSLEEYYLEITAYDYAGNTSNYFYYADDFTNIADDLELDSVLMADLANVTYSSILADYQYVSPNKQLSISIYQDNDKPQIEDLDEWLSASAESYTSFTDNVYIYGQITDDDGLDNVTLTIYNVDSDTDSSNDTVAREGVAYLDGSKAFTLDITAGAIDWGSDWTMAESYGSELEDAIYYFTITADDIYVESGSTTGSSSFGDPVYFGIDKTKPTITLDTLSYGDTTISDPNNYGTILNDEFTISGVATDSIFIHTIEVIVDDGDTENIYSSTYSFTDAKFDNTSILNVLSTDSDSGLSYDWTCSIPVIDLSGDVDITVTAYDSDPRNTDSTPFSDSQSISVYVDTESPVVDASEIYYPDDVNGTINISGKSSDNYQLSNITYTIGAITGDSSDSTSDIELDGNIWSIEFDTKKLFVDNETYLNSEAVDFDFNILAWDEAGNVSVDLSSPYNVITVDPSSDEPEITFDSSTYQYKRGEYMTGTVTDDDGVLSGSIKVEFYEYPDGDVLKKTVIATDTKITDEMYDWSIYIEDDQDLDYLDQGPYYLKVTADDDYTKKINGTSDDSISSTIELEKIVLDDGAPTITETTIGSSTLIYKNSDIAMEGKAIDGTEISSVVVTYTIDGDDVGSLTGVEYSSDTDIWSVDLPIIQDGTDDGEYEFTITATDLYGNEKSITRRVEIDTEAPLVSITAPLNNESTDSSSYTIEGTARDYGAGFDGDNDIEYRFDETEDWTELKLTGTSWSADVSLGDDEGTSTLYIQSTDELGNVYNESRTFYYDSSYPELTETNVGTVDTQFTLDTLTFSGTSYDSNELTSLKAYIDDIEIDTIEVDLDGEDNNLDTTSDNNSWSYTTDNTLEDGTYSVKFIATDSALKTSEISRNMVVDPTAPTLLVTDFSNDYTYGLTNVSGTIYDEIGVDYVEYQLQDNTWETASLTTTSEENKYNWKGSIELTEEELFTLNIRAYDKAGNLATNMTIYSEDSSSENDTWVDEYNEKWFISNTTIYVDESLPYLTEENNDVRYTNESYTLSGDVDDTFGIQELTVNGIDAKPLSGINWSYSVDSPVEGEYEYSIVATDLAGRTTTLERTIIYDVTSPEVSITTPSLSYLSGTSYAFKGTASEPINSAESSGINLVKYQIRDRVYDSTSDTWSSSSDLDSWIEASGTESWSFSYDLEDGDEGKKTLYVQSYDNAGNISEEISLDFIYDQDAPTLTLTTTPTTLTNKEFTIAGTATDSNGIESNIVEIIVDGVTNEVDIDEDNKWTYTGDLSSKADGYYTIEAITYDVEGRESISISNNIQLDQEVPTVSFTDLLDGESINGTSYTVYGKASDNYQIDTVKYEYRYDTDEYSTKALVNGTNYNWSFDIDLTPDDTYLTDGENILDIIVTVLDKAGNETVSDELSLTINQIDDKPDMDISSIDEYLAPTTILIDADSSQDIITGVVVDDDGVNADSILVKIISSEDVDYEYTASIIKDTGNFVSWFVDLSDLDDGTYTIDSVTVNDDVGDSAENNLYGTPGNDISILSSSSKIIGSISDDDNVDYTTLKVKIDGDSAVTFTDETVDSTRIDWIYQLSSLDSGLHYLEFSGSDINGIPVDWSKYSVDNSKFLILQDDDSPNILIESPNQSGYVNRSEGSNGFAWDDSRIKKLIITATNSDGSSMEINSYLDDTELWYNSENDIDTDGDDTIDLEDQEAYGWDFFFSKENIPDEYTGESITLTYDATDIAGNNSEKERTFTIDDTDPVVVFSYPDSDLKNVNGEITISGTITESNISEVFIMVGKQEIEHYDSSPSSYSQGKTYYWERTIDDVSDFANSDDATEDGTDSNLWILPIKIVAVDMAENETVNTEMNLYVDPDRDAPELDILYPSNGDNIGGSVRLSGTANDDDAISYIEMRIDLDDDGLFNKVIDFWDGSEDNPTGAADGDYDDSFEDESQWYTINGEDSWYQTINKYGELYDGLIYNTESGETVTLNGEISIEIRAVDIYGLAGNVETLTFTLDSTVPTITNQSHYSGDYDNGVFTLTADLGDDDNGGISEVWVSYNAGTNWTQLTVPTTDGSSNTNISRTTTNDMSFSLVLDTVTESSSAYVYNSSTGYKTGQLKMSIKVIDSSNYTTIKDIVIYVDNEVPTIELDTSTGKTDKDDLSGDEVLIVGDASDNGSVAGIEKVYIYFSRDDDHLIDITDGSEISLGTLDKEDDYNSIINDSKYANALIIIDDMDEYGSDSSGGADGDGYSEYITDLVPTTWYVKFDSTNITDGVADLHSVVYDLAGNSGIETTDDVLFANYKPDISEIKIGYDTDRNNSVEDGEKFVYIDDSIPTVYNYLSFDITATDTDGIATYQVLDNSSNILLSSDTGEIDISAYSGEYTFTIKVTDNNDVYSYEYVDVNVSNYDLTSPEVTIYSLDDETYTDENGDLNDNLDSDGLVLSSMDENDNITGHIELGKFSTFDNISESEYDPDLSGIVTINGFIKEDRVIKSMVISIDIEDSVTELVTATYSEGSWVTTESGLTINEVLFGSTGHEISWSYEWDTSTITGVASKDVEFIVTATNYGDSNSEESDIQYGSDSESDIFDIVPYITSIYTELSDLKSNNPSVYNRTALGHYSVSSTETITISGFNLSASNIGTYSETNNTLSLPMTSYTSGELELTVNGITIINNSNDNNSGKSNNWRYNLQSNEDNNTLLTDDIIIDVWEFNSEAAVPISGVIADPVMKINPVSGMIGFAFTNGPLYFSMPGTISDIEYSYMYWQASYDFLTSIAFNYDSNGFSYGSAAGGDINSSAADKFGFMTDHWGKSGLSSGGSYNGTNALRLESIGQKDSDGVVDFNKNRIKSPQYATAVHDDTTNIYLAYYDDINDEIRFKYGNLSNSSTSKTSFGNFTDSETSRNAVTNDESDISIIAGNLTNINPGEYVSIDVIEGDSQSTDIVVAAWYDASETRLLYSYNTTPTTDRGGVVDGTGWSTPIEIFSDGGRFSQLSVDKTGGIHIAGYDNSNGDLIYAYLDTYSDTTVETCIVDSFGIVGSEITLDTALDSNENVIPYIGYYSNSSVRPKYAYLVNTTESAPDGAIDEVYTGDWEITVIPTSSEVPQDRINVGVWKDGDGKVTASTTGTSSYTNNYSSYNSTSYGKCYGNGTSNGVIAYAITSSSDGFIETAQMK